MELDIHQRYVRDVSRVSAQGKRVESLQLGQQSSRNSAALFYFNNNNGSLGRACCSSSDSASISVSLFDLSDPHNKANRNQYSSFSSSKLEAPRGQMPCSGHRSGVILGMVSRI